MKYWKLILIFVLAALLAGLVNATMFNKPIDKGMDIYYSWVEGGRLLNGENPYARILSGNMRENDKYATYFPLFYILSYLSQRAGFIELEAWVSLWRVVFILFEFALAALILFYLADKKRILLGVIGILFWYFNRWTLYQIRVAYFDFLPIFFMVLSLMLYPRHRTWSLLSMSVSLAFKQIAVFLLPLYILWIWQEARENRVKEILVATCYLAVVPLVTSIPFLVWNAEGFIRSIFFSVTRDAADQFGVPTLSVRMDWTGIPARLPMFILMFMVYWASFKKQLGKFMSAFLVMLMFVEFNPVQFRQYLLWLDVFIPFLLVDSSPWASATNEAT